MDLTTGDAWSRIRLKGYKGVGVIELLAVALSRESRDVGANEANAALIAKRMPGSRLLGLSPADLSQAAGLEEFEAARVLSALELGRRAGIAGQQAGDPVSDQNGAYEVFRYLESEIQENFCVAFMNAKGQVTGQRTIHVGTLTMSVVGPREVFREAVREAAASVIVAHNHPSGDPAPSSEDIEITRKLAEVGRLLDIPVLDHIIVGHGRYTSLHDLGVL